MTTPQTSRAWKGEPGGPMPSAGRNSTVSVAAVLAIFSALLYGVISGLWLPPLFRSGTGVLASWFVVPIAAQLAVVVLLGVGGVAMFRDKRFGRTWVVAGSGLAVLLALVGFLSAAVYRVAFNSAHGLDAEPAVTGSAVMSTVFSLLPALVTLVFAHREPSRSSRR